MAVGSDLKAGPEVVRKMRSRADQSETSFCFVERSMGRIWNMVWAVVVSVLGDVFVGCGYFLILTLA